MCFPHLFGRLYSLMLNFLVMLDNSRSYSIILPPSYSLSLSLSCSGNLFCSLPPKREGYKRHQVSCLATFLGGISKIRGNIRLTKKKHYQGVRARGKNTIPRSVAESHASESQQYSHIRVIPSSIRMANTNPHRFPRPPTLPQSKIQIQSQREHNLAESGHPTSAAMVGRIGGQSTFGVGKEKEESGSPGAFATSFDLLSIARVVPAKQRRVGNPMGVGEGQVAGTSATESPVGVHGDWRKQPSATAAESPSTPDTAKSMIFRRTIATPGSRIVRRSSGAFSSDEMKDAKDNQSTTGGPGASTWGHDGIPFFESKGASPPMETEKGMEIEMSPQEARSAKFLDRQQQDEQDYWIEDFHQDGETSNDIKNPKEGSGRNSLMRNSRKRMDPTAMFQPITTASQPSESDDSVGFTQTSVPMTLAKGLNDSAGALRAVAIPFEPKQVSNTGLEAPSKIRLEERTSASAKISPKLKAQLDPFAHLLPDSFYGKASKPPTVNPALPSHVLNVQKPPMGAIKWKLEDHGQTVKILGDGSSIFGASGTVHKKSSLGDAGISRLWNFPGKADGNQAVGSEPPGLGGLNRDNFNPNAKSILASGVGPNTMLPNKPRTEQITVRDEAQEQIVPIPRSSSNSHVKIVERLEREAMVLSEGESDIVTSFLVKASVTDCTQDPVVGANPVPQLDQHGRRGAISMQGTIRGLEGGGAGDERPKSLSSESKSKGLMVVKESETRSEKWLELGGGVNIRIKGEDSSGQTEYWPYPYPGPYVNEAEIATGLFLKLREQLFNYIAPANLDGIKSDKDYWRYELRKSKSRYLPGKEPWFGGDNTSFFDISFGVNPTPTIRKTTVNPPPGLSSTPAARAQAAAERAGKTQSESSGLRDLVESSIPDYSDCNNDYHKLCGKAIQEWNTTPASGGTPLNGRGEASRQGAITGRSVYESTGGQVDVGGRDTVLLKDSEMSRGAAPMKQPAPRAKFGAVTVSPANGGGWELNGQRVRNESFEERLRRRRPEQKQELFGGVRKLGRLVFGSDEESDGM